MSVRIEQLNKKVNLILEYIVKKEEAESCKNKYEYEYSYYIETKNGDTSQNTHLKELQGDYIKCLNELGENIREIEASLIKW